MAEAERFLEKADELIKASNDLDGLVLLTGSTETGAVRRASMDLTRELARMRASGTKREKRR